MSRRRWKWKQRSSQRRRRRTETKNGIINLFDFIKVIKWVIQARKIPEWSI